MNEKAIKCEIVFDLFDYVDKNIILSREWYAGEQLDLLHEAFPKALFITEYMDDYYQGEWYAVFKFNDLYFVLNGYFGSCGWCDSLEGSGQNGLDYLQDVCNNAGKFKSLNSLKKYIEVTEDYGWSEVKNHLLTKLGD